jgi:hypothetical protein
MVSFGCNPAILWLEPSAIYYFVPEAVGPLQDIFLFRGLQSTGRKWRKWWEF